jgi:predicted acyltransferase
MEENIDSKSKRFVSLDALKVSHVLIYGGGVVFYSAGAATDAGFSLVGRSRWSFAMHGFHFYDMIFPLFLFISAFLFLFRGKKGKQQARMYRMSIRRVIFIVLELVTTMHIRFDLPICAMKCFGRVLLEWCFCAYFI